MPCVQVKRATQHVVMFSGGIGSFAAACRVRAAHGHDNMMLLFADTKIEDDDLYRFVEQASGALGARLVRIADGRTPWQVFKSHKFIGNSRVDLCSRILKREITDKWIASNCDPKTTICYVGIDWTEQHRFDRLVERKKPWIFRAPLCEPPMYRREEALQKLREMRIDVPRLYKMGFAHNNCGGFCVKAGQAQFAHLLKTMPERYAAHAEQEQKLRAYLGKDVAIMRDRRGGQSKPLTMNAFAARTKRGEHFDEFAWGGCGCFSDGEEA